MEMPVEDNASYVPSEELTQMLSQVKIDMMRRPDSTFLTSVFLNLDHQWDASIEKLAVGNLTIKYNPEYFMSLNRDQRRTTLMRATMHAALMHPERMGARNPRKWGKAAGFTVNEMLQESGYELAEGMTVNPQFAGKSPEEIYDLLPDDPPGANNNNGGWDDCINKPETQQAAQQAQDKMQNIVVQAAQQAQMANQAGSIPGQFQLFIDKLLNPKLPYKKLLQPFLTKTCKSDYSMQRPNRRFVQQGLYLPSLKSDGGLVNIMTGVDISGSVSDSDFAQFVSDTHTVMKQFKPEKIDFVQFDTKIQHHDVIKSLDDLKKLEFHGRGGTDPTDLILLAQKMKPKVLMIYTDGYFGTEGLPVYEGHTLWIIHNNESFVAPFGKAIHYELLSDY